MSQPVIYMIAGPNGAGKTTAAMELLKDFQPIKRFLNADEIARGLNPLNPAGQAISAGKVMLDQMTQMIRRRDSFAFESTGASQIFVKRLSEARAAGYELGLIFLWLPSYAMASHRVSLRVMQGGHDIPDEVIKRRFKRGLSNIFNSYIPIMNLSEIYDNREPETKLVACCLNSAWEIFNPETWKLIEASRKFND